MNTGISPSSSPPGTFRQEERLQLSNRNSILTFGKPPECMNSLSTGYTGDLTVALEPPENLMTEVSEDSATSGSYSHCLVRLVFFQLVAIITITDYESS